MTRADPWHTRPEGDRFVSDQRYWRPQLGVWRLWLWRDAVHTTHAIALTTVAAGATAVLAGIRVWRYWTEPHNETGD